LTQGENRYTGAHAAESDSGGTAYYQVSASVLNPDTLRRELSVLHNIRDNHPKYLLTLDDIPSRASHEGIM